MTAQNRTVEQQENCSLERGSKTRAPPVQLVQRTITGRGTWSNVSQFSKKKVENNKDDLYQVTAH